MASKSTSNLIAGISLIIIVLNFALFIKPTRAEIKEAQVEIEKNNTEKNLQIAELERLGLLNKDIPQDNVSRNKLLTLAPEGLNQSALIEGISEIAKSNGIILYSINFDQQGEDEKIKGLQKVSIQTSMSGQYANLTSFLKSIEENSRALNIKSINLQKSENQTKTGNTINFNLFLEAYYQ